MRLTIATLRGVVKGNLTIQFVPQALTSYGGLELLGRYLRPRSIWGRGCVRPPGDCAATTAVRGSRWCCWRCPTSGPDTSSTCEGMWTWH
jgi:hypothetical protein